MSTQTNSIAEAKSIPSKIEIIRMMEDFDRSKNVNVKEFCEMHEISQLPELLPENWKPAQ